MVMPGNTIWEATPQVPFGFHTIGGEVERDDVCLIFVVDDYSILICFLFFCWVIVCC